jgi:predicted membrane protein
MSRKSMFGIIIGVLIFGAILLSGETSITLWQLPVGFVVAWVLALGFTHLRNAFFLLIMTLVLLLTVYLSIKYRLFGIYIGGIVGVATALMMHFGWINIHTPFNRSDYIKAQDAIRKERTEK